MECICYLPPSSSFFEHIIDRNTWLVGQPIPNVLLTSLVQVSVKIYNFSCPEEKENRFAEAVIKTWQEQRCTLQAADQYKVQNKIRAFSLNLTAFFLKADF